MSCTTVMERAALLVEARQALDHEIVTSCTVLYCSVILQVEALQALDHPNVVKLFE